MLTCGVEFSKNFSEYKKKRIERGEGQANELVQKKREIFSLGINTTLLSNLNFTELSLPSSGIISFSYLF